MENTIRIARDAGIDKILVTTDDVDVITIAAAAGVKYLNRPKDLCTDDARMEGVVENAVHYAMSATDGPHWEFDTICLMQVTSPLLRTYTLQHMIETYSRTGGGSVTAVSTIYEPAGAVYIVDRELFMKNKTFYQEEGHLYMLPADQCIDVDFLHQLQIANIVAGGRST